MRRLTLKEIRESFYVEKDEAFEDVLRHFCSVKKFYDRQQFFQLRCISKALQGRTKKIEYCVEKKEFEDVIHLLEVDGVIDATFYDTNIKNYKRQFDKIIETFLGKENVLLLKKGSSYAMDVYIMERMNLLMNCYNEEDFKDIRKGKLESAQLKFITFAYEIFNAWSYLKEVTISDHVVVDRYREMRYTSNYTVEQEKRNLQQHIEEYQNIAAQHKDDGDYVAINEILEQELKSCSSRISERCHERLGNKIKMIEIGFPPEQTE